ncbi:MAG: hypothetical protein RBR71_09255 [Gudongella sp.]|nr:hypothetical protein [Gudongella sp.]
MDLIEKLLYIIGIVLLLLFVIRGIFSIGYKKRVNKNINILKMNQGISSNKDITVNDLKHLPGNVQRWLIKSGIIGKKTSSYVYIEQKGEMRQDESSNKLIFASTKQFAGIQMPGFVWQVKAAFIPFINMYGMDSFVDGVGSLEMRLFNLVKVVNEKDTVKINQSSFARYLLELSWYPEAALNKNMKWEEIDKYTARVMMSHRGIVAEAYLYFNEDYDVIKTSAMRYKDTDETEVLLECVGESKEFGVFNGVRIPSEIHVTWMLPEGEFTWYKLKVEKLSYK